MCNSIEHEEPIDMYISNGIESCLNTQYVVRVGTHKRRLPFGHNISRSAYTPAPDNYSFSMRGFYQPSITAIAAVVFV